MLIELNKNPIIFKPKQIIIEFENNLKIKITESNYQGIIIERLDHWNLLRTPQGSGKIRLWK